jgi:hypothetical protein
MIHVDNPYVAQRIAAETTDRREIADGYGEATLRGLLGSLRTEAQAFEYGTRAQLMACVADLRSWAGAYRARTEAIRTGVEPSDDARTDAARWETVADEIDQFAADWLREELGPAQRGVPSDRCQPLAGCSRSARHALHRRAGAVCTAFSGPERSVPAQEVTRWHG